MIVRDGISDDADDEPGAGRFEIGNSDDSAGVELVESMAAVEFCPDEGIVRASYDSARDPAGLAVIAVVAIAGGTAPTALAPLQSTIDVTALDDLFAATGAGRRNGGRVSFRYGGFDVTIGADGTIEASPATNAT